MQTTKIKSLTRKIIVFDIIVNIIIGNLLLFNSNFVNSFLFNKNVFPFYLYFIFGVGLFFFAIWQITFFIKPNGLTVKNLRFAALLAWLPCFCLSWGLFSTLGQQLLPNAKILLWLANSYMFLLGGLYWYLAKK